MNKKISLFLIIAALLALCLIPLFVGTNTSYQEACISKEEAETVIASRSLNKDLVFSVSFNGRELVFDEALGTYFYSVTEGEESSFTPDIRVESDHGRVSAAFVETGITEEAIRSDTAIPLLFYNADYYMEAELKCTTLPIMSIECSGDITDEYTDMTMELEDNRKEAVKSLVKSDGLIRRRGGITSEFPKFPLRLKLQYHSPGESRRSFRTSLLGMQENSSWILYPAYNDEDKIRNVFSQNLWYDTVGDKNSFGISTGPEYRFLEVFMNGSYQGLYALGYTIDETGMGIDPNDDDQGIFKKVLDTRYDLLEMRERNEDAVRGYRLITDEEELIEGISDKWGALVRYFLYLDENGADSEKLLDAIDVDNAMYYALFVDMVQGDDSIYKNFYLAIKKDSLGRMKTLYCPWDLDATWGNEFKETALNRFAQYSHPAEYNFFMEDTYLEQVLVNADTDTLDRFIAAYRELRSGAWSDESITAMLDSYEKDIFGSGAYLREMERWPDANYVEDPQKGLTRFKSYVLERLAEYDGYFDRLEAVREEGTLTRRCASLKHFNESDYVMDIKDRSILQDPEYISFMESICPIDFSRVTEDVRYIVYLRDKDMVYYLPDIGTVGDSYVTDDFVLSIDLYEDADYFLFYDEWNYTVFLNGIPCYDSSPIVNEKLILSAIYEGVGSKVNTALDYHLDIDESVYEVAPEFVAGK
jgi:hypothetical protein